MIPLRTATASVATVGSLPAGYVHGCVALTSAHASTTNIQLCFQCQRPRSTPLPSLDHRWVLVLAGGSGTRLASLTRTADGAVVPKQYCSLRGGRSLLGDALARADGLVGRDRVVVVVAAQHEAFWRRDLRDRDPANIVVQPHDRGTAAGVLLPLLRIEARDPHAQVTFVPSDHFAADETVLAAALDRAQTAAARAARIVLLGIAPDGPEADYGWVVPGEWRHGIRLVRRFVEKPTRSRAAALMRSGGVWNSFLLVGTAERILRLYATRLPSLLGAMRAAEQTGDRRRAALLYAHLPAADFCRDLLAGAEGELGLLAAPPCGWTDLGTPARVARCAQWLGRTRQEACCAGSLGAAALHT